MGIDSGIGSLGEVVFEVSANTVRTFDEYRRTARAVYADHETMSGKPASEFTGLELDDVTFTMTFNAALGVVPDQEVDVLEEMLHSGNAHMLVIGTRTRGYFTIRQFTESYRQLIRGIPVVVGVDVTLKEYDPRDTGAGAEAMTREQSSRGSTGKGGPRKVPGAKPALQDRQLSVKG